MDGLSIGDDANFDLVETVGEIVGGIAGSLGLDDLFTDWSFVAGTESANSSMGGSGFAAVDTADDPMRWDPANPDALLLASTDSRVDDIMSRDPNQWSPDDALDPVLSTRHMIAAVMEADPSQLARLNAQMEPLVDSEVRIDRIEDPAQVRTRHIEAERRANTETDAWLARQRADDLLARGEWLGRDVDDLLG